MGSLGRKGNITAEMITNWMKARMSNGVSVAMKLCSLIFSESSAVITTVTMVAKSTSPWNTMAPIAKARMLESSVVMPKLPGLADIT
ncbi:MAG: hypothetical protein IPO56_15360 [Flavobacteriales bacterium]|nr:hypothetical protein [Flavobacteriales bacterium]